MLWDNKRLDGTLCVWRWWSLDVLYGSDAVRHVWLLLSFVMEMNKSVFLLRIHVVFHPEVSSCCVSLEGLLLVHIIHGVNSELSLFSAQRLLYFVALRCLQISQESPRRSNGERKCVQRGKCMQILRLCVFLQPLRSTKDERGFLSFQLSTLLTCDNMKQKRFDSGGATTSIKYKYEKDFI